MGSIPPARSRTEPALSSSPIAWKGDCNRFVLPRVETQGVSAPIEPIAKENDMKEPGWYSMRKAYRCRKYVGGDYIGVWESVTLDIVGDSGSETMHIKLADHPCGESELTKLLYDELLRRMTDLYGEAAMTMPATKKEWFSVRQKASSRQGLDVVCFSFKLFPLPLMHVLNFQGRNCV